MVNCCVCAILFQSSLALSGIDHSSSYFIIYNLSGPELGTRKDVFCGNGTYWTDGKGNSRIVCIEPTKTLVSG